MSQKRDATWPRSVETKRVLVADARSRFSAPCNQKLHPLPAPGPARRAPVPRGTGAAIGAVTGQLNPGVATPQIILVRPMNHPRPLTNERPVPLLDIALILRLTAPRAGAAHLLVMAVAALRITKHVAFRVPPFPAPLRGTQRNRRVTEPTGCRDRNDCRARCVGCPQISLHKTLLFT